MTDMRIFGLSTFGLICACGSAFAEPGDFDGRYAPYGDDSAYWDCETVGVEGGGFYIEKNTLLIGETGCTLINPSSPSASGAVTFDASCNAEGTEFTDRYTLEKTDFGVIVTGGDRISSNWQRCDVGGVGLGTSANADQDCSGWHREEADLGFWSQATLDDVKRCIADGTEVNPTGSGSAALIHAAEIGFYEAVVALLNAGADPSVRHSELDFTPLHLAAGNGDLETVTALLEQGADPNIVSHYGSPLHYAAEHGTPEVVLVLLDASADPTLKTEGGETATDMALRNFRFIGTNAFNRIAQSSQKPIPSGCEGWGGPRYIGAEDFWDDHDPTVSQVQRCLDTGANPNGVYHNGIGEPIGTVLGTVVAKFERYSRPFEIAQALLDAGADPNAIYASQNSFNGYNYYPILHKAFRSSMGQSRWEMFLALLNAGADPNSRDPAGRTSLHKALWADASLETVKVLLDAGADPGVQDEDGDAPLHIAIWHNESLETVKVLLDAGADPGVQDEDGDAPLHKALLAVTRADSSLETASLETLQALVHALVQVLLDAGADPNVQDEDGDAPLHKALRNKTTLGTVQALLDAGADLDIPNRKGDYPLQIQLHKALSLSNNFQTEKLEQIQILLNAGANPDVQNSVGRTPLHHALRARASLEMVQAFLDAGADLGVQDRDGYAPLHESLWSDGSLETVQALLDAGANPDVQDNRGRTSLHLAAKRGTAEIVQLLLNAGARNDLKTDDGAYPSDIAEMHRGDNVRRLFASLPVNEPTFETLSGNRNGFVLLAEELCDRSKNVEKEIYIGTSIVGVKISNDVCVNLQSLIDRGYECVAHGGRSLFGGTGITTFKCDNRNSEIELYVKNNASHPLPSTGSWNTTYTRYLNQVSLDIRTIPLDRIKFNCHVFNSCTVTGDDLAQFLVDELAGLDEMSAIEIKNDGDYIIVYEGVTDFGEIIRTSDVAAIRAGLTLFRGAIDSYSSGGISLD